MVEYTQGHTFNIKPHPVHHADMKRGWYAQFREDADEGIIYGPYDTEEAAAECFHERSTKPDTIQLRLNVLKAARDALERTTPDAFEALVRATADWANATLFANLPEPPPKPEPSQAQPNDPTFLNDRLKVTQLDIHQFREPPQPQPTTLAHNLGVLKTRAERVLRALDEGDDELARGYLDLILTRLGTLLDPATSIADQGISAFIDELIREEVPLRPEPKLRKWMVTGETHYVVSDFEVEVTAVSHEGAIEIAKQMSRHSYATSPDDRPEIEMVVVHEAVEREV